MKASEIIRKQHNERIDREIESLASKYNISLKQAKGLYKIMFEASTQAECGFIK